MDSDITASLPFHRPQHSTIFAKPSFIGMCTLMLVTSHDSQGYFKTAKLLPEATFTPMCPNEHMRFGGEKGLIFGKVVKKNCLRFSLAHWFLVPLQTRTTCSAFNYDLRLIFLPS
jgi:hypothetical protein